jgi:phage shock protein E
MKFLKSLSLFLYISLMLVSCKEVVDKSTNTLKPKQASEVKTTVFATDVNVANFKNLVDTKAGLLIDVRTPQEYANGHIAGAINIDWINKAVFKAKIKAIAKDKTVLIYCHSGHRSGMAKKFLQEQGYSKIYNLESGIKGWKSENLPVEK